MATTADDFVAGKTTEQVVRDLATAEEMGFHQVVADDGSELLTREVLSALVARFDKRAAKREVRGMRAAEAEAPGP